MCGGTSTVAGLLAIGIPLLVTAFLMFTLDKSGEELDDITISETVACKKDNLDEYYYPAVAVFTLVGLSWIFLIVWRYNVIRNNLIQCNEYTTFWRLLNYTGLIGVIGSISLSLTIGFCIPDHCQQLHSTFAALFFYCFIVYQICHFVLSFKECKQCWQWLIVLCFLICTLGTFGGIILWNGNGGDACTVGERDGHTGEWIAVGCIVWHFFFYLFYTCNQCNSSNRQDNALYAKKMQTNTITAV